MNLKKRTCVVLIKRHNDKTYSVIGVFKNEKQADKYLAWLDAKNKQQYIKHHTIFYNYQKVGEEE